VRPPRHEPRPAARVSRRLRCGPIPSAPAATFNGREGAAYTAVVRRIAACDPGGPPGLDRARLWASEMAEDRRLSRILVDPRVMQVVRCVATREGQRDLKCAIRFFLPAEVERRRRMDQLADEVSERRAAEIEEELGRTSDESIADLPLLRQERVQRLRADHVARLKRPARTTPSGRAPAARGHKVASNASKHGSTLSSRMSATSCWNPGTVSRSWNSTRASTVSLGARPTATGRRFGTGGAAR
jgi:hypothetical protein